MHVWYMNLKDDRGSATKDSCIQKCNYCFQHNIVGVGWAVENECGLFKQIKKLEEHYILRISDAKIRVAKNDISRNNDIGFYLCWDKKVRVNDADVPQGIALRKIIQPQRQSDIILKTLEIFNKGYDEL